MNKILTILVALIALTVMAPGHAEEKPTVIGNIVSQAEDKIGAMLDIIATPLVNVRISDRDVDCLARNIYHEAAGEPEEGKVAVAMVTINRMKDGRFGKTICDVVNQRTVKVTMKEVTEIQMVQTSYFGQPEKQIVTKVVAQNVTVCQFSWRCMLVRKPHDRDERWQSSQEVATELLKGQYQDLQVKYNSALYFHATAIRPVWAKQKKYVARIHGHIFYSDNI
jgi:spore germination cell wall hydrolase CwlJ-like protein